MRTKTTILALAACVAALGIAACGGDDNDDEGGASATSAETATEEPTVSFIEPTDGATTGDSVTAEVALEGFEIDAAQVGKAAEEGHGHLHFSLDGGEYDLPKYSGANGKLAEQLGVDGQYSPATEPTITYKGLPPGEHTLDVALANNDHSDTGVTASTTFTVE